ncbi:MAG TPA: 4Fe-4S dicluster domain-containing protein [Ktedonobacterales bacterium]|jgi:formate dehydrogenase iron-sulfur subunit
MTKGFFTDTTLCIGCKACEVACKQWNQLPGDNYEFTGMSYDNTAALGATTWRHVAFVEQMGRQPNGAGDGATDGATAIAERVSNPSVGFLGENRWLMMSDVCKHCTNAGCLDACPTGAIIRNEFGDVYVQPDICNGCGYCQIACPFGVIEVSHDDGRAWKCTLCYDRQKDGLEPACAKACPTQSIQFGEVEELQERARERVGMLHARGVTDAYLYGVDERTSVGPLNAFFLLVDRPEVYNLPERPKLPQARVGMHYLATGLTALAFGAAAALTLLGGRRK